ncbi:16S rRNA (uracil(1498)-N(3))-methyltransferase [Stenotrophomonas sp. Sm10]|uniref:16S rRNA (uracil(1498)-N(3))-methyltransferase n=1 Tax=Stenotrophomonas sp. Sm10 TaxID=3002754 RepID=UPI0027E43DB1|nr:16S rRNA (uracil(1498)-N(3))-methyltransferase [Stenotrophomonas sp. Sm10]MDQ7311822.1 16S rRNA (uracil(1498)-N(3))-methyltransferase [Stenotrophomonas sp. Sm10]
MRVTRCPIDLALHSGQTVTLPEETANHLVRVMRLREGDTCVLFNGDGHDYSATLTAAGKREVQVRIDAVQAVDNESPLAIILLQGIARGEKMDLILQKATELGVAAIIPVNAERTEVKLDAARAEKRVSHWNNVVTSACGQSGRASIPQVGPPLSLAQAAAALPADTLRLTLDPLGAHRLSTLDAAPAGGIVIAIGPEGGWSPRDRDQLAAAGFQGLQLGPRILRTETAGLAAIAALQARLGDLG